MLIFLGSFLILIGILIFRFPVLVPYFIATVLVMAGAGLVLVGLGVGWRPTVTYRRIDPGSHDQEIL